ncbi:nucleoside deaminase [Jannaschia seohaensis]|uniref:tRNA-specific adenosine deaminase n=1 Tax=Jannaschia seohaensis TaxID=475081 RepID=A0A2Y9ABV7_9RHOB|nr:nucleoside deaminase [Jannaschia seohaensis]PWJ21016.1 tRNA(Arg) A34 adenosine deaminase TadA [Jannaschia seohaensis]SSA41426.1 tRNA(Arg) A34 adenosine deaminase TadA [Jannaschia seohaensis]
MFRSFMPLALDAARAAAARGEVPVGAVISRGDEAIAVEGNRMREQGDPTGHAEMLAIRAACAALGVSRLSGCAIWVTLEPCAMCAGAIAHARLDRLHFGAADPKSGGVLHGARVFSHPQAHHRPEIHDGIDAEASASLLRDFFEGRR